MNIELSQIKPSPTPIRSTWDEDKLDELAQSIKEQGLIVPIKIRPAISICDRHGAEWFGADMDRVDELINCPGCYDMLSDEVMDGDVPIFEIVYGHRRLEACRIAELDSVDAIVEGVDDTDVLIQALIENVQREDMEPGDVADTLELIMELKNWNQYDLERNGVMPRWKASYYLSLERVSPKWKGRTTTSHGGARKEGTIGIDHIRETLPVGLSDDDLDSVLEKAAGEEKLTPEQTRKVAESVAATEDPKMRERLIDAPYSPYTHDPEYARERADRYGSHDPMARDKTPPLDEAWKLTAEVSMIVDFIKKSRQMYEEIIKMDELGKFSPEARPFLVGKLKSTARQIIKVIDRLEG